MLEGNVPRVNDGSAVEGSSTTRGAAVGTATPRRGFLKYIVAGSVAASAAAWLGEDPPVALARPSPAQDRNIFNFALLLEYALDAFYAEALAHRWPRGEVKELAQVAGEHERAHARYLARALGKRARRKPAFDFGPATRAAQPFLRTARELEDLAVAAYNGQAANLTKPGLAAAVRIVSVEARHAAWARALSGVDPAPRAADPGEDPATVSATLKRLGIR